MVLALCKAFLMINHEAIELESIQHQLITRAEALGLDNASRCNFRPDDLRQRILPIELLLFSL
jgi:hypothetical protein